MLRRLFRQSSLYALTSVASKLSGFVLLAFYGDPAYLSQAEFGYLGELDAVKMLVLLLAGAGLPLGIIRFASSGALTEAERAAVPITALVLASAAAFATASAGWAFAPLAVGTLFDTPGGAEALRWLSVYVGFRTVSDVSYTVLRQQEKAGAFVRMAAAESALLAACVIAFLVQGQGLIGVMRGYALSAAVVAAVATPALLMRVDRRVRWGLVRPMLAFGVPLIASGLAARFLSVGDRFLIVRMIGPEANAVYEWASRFGGVLNTFLVYSFTLSFTVLGLKALDETGSPDLHRQAFRHFAALAGWMTLGLGLFVNDVSRALTDNATYHDVDALVVLIAGGFAFHGLYYVVVNVLYAAGRTRAVALSVGLAAGLNLGLNLLLIPRTGIAGAAVATLVAYAALSVLTARLARQSLDVPYPWRVVVVAVVLAGGLWALSVPTAGWDAAPRFAARAGLALAYLPGLLALGVYGRDDLARARDLLRRRGRDAP